MVFMFSKELYNIVLWNLFFLAVNVVQLTLIILERRPVHFSEEERAIREEVFGSEHGEVASVLGRLGVAYELLDRREDAEGAPGPILLVRHIVVGPCILRRTIV